MSANRAKRLQPVQRISAERERDAARELGECQRRMEQLQQQLQELESYRDEYRQHYRQNGSAGLSAQKLRQLQHFLAHIDTAISQQQQAIVGVGQLCEKKKQEWFQARGRTQALDKVAERYQLDERQQQNRREQKESDDYALRRYALLHK